MVAASNPGMRIGRSEERFDFLPYKEGDHGASETLTGDGQDPLNVLGLRGLLEGGVAEEGADGGEAHIATACCAAAALLQVIEKRTDQRRINVGEVQAGGWLMLLLLRKVQQQAEGIAIRGDRVRAGLSLSHQALGKEALQ